MQRTTTFVPKVLSGRGALNELPSLLDQIASNSELVFFLVDEYFITSPLLEKVLASVGAPSEVLSISSRPEPTTDGLDKLTRQVKIRISSTARCDSTVLVGLGGGSVLDTTKALSVLLTNDLPAAQLQGWDLPSSPGVTKIGIPTLSGTGAEASRTAVLTNVSSGLKLGINSDFSVFDGVILDPELTSSVPEKLFFFNGMDAYMHAFEILEGRYRNTISDSLASAALSKCESVFSSEELMSDRSRLDLMNASFLAGTALTSSYVGAVHPISAAIGVGYGIPHGLANVVSLTGLEEYYPDQRRFVIESAKRFGIDIPPLSSMTSSLSLKDMYSLATKHSKPLENQLGRDWNDDFTLAKFEEIVLRMR